MSAPNYPSICSCASPECLENGCILMRRYSQVVPPMPLTADDVRRIVREELARAEAQMKRSEG